MDLLDKTIVLIDAANLWNTVKDLGFNVDFAKLRDYLEKEYNILRLFYFTALAEGEDWMFKLVDWLQFNGYTVRSKPAKSRDIGFKGDMDVDIAVDALRLTGHYQHAILFSGDGDLRVLIEALQFAGISVTVCHTQKGSVQRVSYDLIKQADRFIDLADIRPTIAQTQTRTNS